MKNNVNILEAVEKIGKQINEKVSEPQQKTVEEILYDFTGKLKEIDFSVLKTTGNIVFINDGQTTSDGKQPKSSEYVVLTALAISRLAEQHKLYIRSISDTLHVYTGTHYEPIKGGMLRKWLIACSEKVGSAYLDMHHPKNIVYYIQAFSDYCTALSEWRGEVSKRAINVANGIISFDEKGNVILTPHTHELPYRYCLKYKYDKNAKAPTFGKFLDKVLPNEQAQKLLQAYIGSMFTDTPPQKIAFLLGYSGANGKSVFVDSITALLNPANISNYTITTLCDEERGKDARKGIEGKLLNVCTELGKEIEGSGIFKKLAEGSTITGNRKYHDNEDITDYARLLFACNELPKTNDFSGGYFRRLAIIPFRITISPKEQDPKLTSKIIENDLSGVLNWVVDGVRLFVGNNYKLPPYEEGEEIVAEYRRESDSVLSFLSDKDIKKGAIEIPYTKFYGSYRAYAEGFGYKPAGKPTFSKRLKEIGIIPRSGTNHVTVVDISKSELEL